MEENDVRNHPWGEELEKELDRLLAAYREACVPPEPSPNFMPRLWEKIEARRSVVSSFGRLTRAFVTAAAAVCLLLVVLQTTTRSQPSFYTQSYVEALAEAAASEGQPYTEIGLYELPAGELNR